jgi:hypothetical protein
MLHRRHQDVCFCLLLIGLFSLGNSTGLWILDGESSSLLLTLVDSAKRKSLAMKR